MNLISTHSEYCFANGEQIVKTEDRFSSTRVPPATSILNFSSQCNAAPYLAKPTFDRDDVSSSSQSPSPEAFSLSYLPSLPQHLLFQGGAVQNGYFSDRIPPTRNFASNHSRVSGDQICPNFKSGSVPRKERRRTHNINSAFSALRNCIPNVPSDTKLSKIKTLRLATSYISYLMDVLSKDDPNSCGSFKADIVKKSETRQEKKKRENEVRRFLLIDI